MMIHRIPAARAAFNPWTESSRIKASAGFTDSFCMAVLKELGIRLDPLNGIPCEDGVEMPGQVAWFQKSIQPAAG